jgi:hypothetical protein
MKHLARILSLIILVGSTVFFAACDGGDGDDKSEKEIQIDKLVGTWTASSVTYNGDDQSSDYTTFTITIAKSSNENMSYTVSGRPTGLSPWDANGTFSFSSPISSKLSRGDGVIVDYVVDGNTLKLTLENYAGEGYEVGRVETVEGDWVFNMTK